ncbi:MAG TPA: hypothetical protein EYP85_03175 [Armatimonadetes bacterium]|nr:hypothetical protein [Armatimonadota bacterium]
MSPVTTAESDVMAFSISSRPPTGPFDYPLTDWAAAGLHRPSVIEPRIITVDHYPTDYRPTYPDRFDRR